MRVGTVTTRHENGVGLCVVTELKAGGWIPAFAGMTGVSAGMTGVSAGMTGVSAEMTI